MLVGNVYVQLPPCRELSTKLSEGSSVVALFTLLFDPNGLCHADAACASLNFTKRYQQADLASMVVLVTGARVKIGALHV